MVATVLAARVNTLLSIDMLGRELLYLLFDCFLHEMRLLVSLALRLERLLVLCLVVAVLVLESRHLVLVPLVLLACILLHHLLAHLRLVCHKRRRRLHPDTTLSLLNALRHRFVVLLGLLS